MIRIRKASRVKNIVGACFLAAAALLLWVEHTIQPEHTGWLEASPAPEVKTLPEPVPVLRAPTPIVDAWLEEAHG